ncbi:uncharacterized protein LOC135502568 [Lineus longissimus]|uniref:uncharacterized protein LOC135502568 n=1 Tax=Lineus longissimus TaxID=88925 RepID=UPI00315C72F1
MKQGFDRLGQKIKGLSERLTDIEDRIVQMDQRLTVETDGAGAEGAARVQRRGKTPTAIKTAVHACYNAEGNELQYNVNETFKSLYNEKVSAHISAVVRQAQNEAPLDTIRVSAQRLFTSRKRAAKEREMSEKAAATNKMLKTVRSRKKRLFQSRSRHLRGAEEKDLWDKVKERDMSAEEDAEDGGEKVLRRISNARKRKPEVNELVALLDSRMDAYTEWNSAPKLRRI